MEEDRPCTAVVGPTIIVLPALILVRQVITSMDLNPCEGNCKTHQISNAADSNKNVCKEHLLYVGFSNAAPT